MSELSASTACGFEALPPSFYTLSSLYPVPDDAPYKKNTHASACAGSVVRS